MISTRFSSAKACVSWVLLAFFLYACDRWEEDIFAEFSEFAQLDKADDKTVTLPSSPVLIDLATRLPVGTPVTFRLHGKAKRGETALLSGG